MRRSSGCLVLHGDKVLLIRRRGGGWGLPKGGVEPHLTKKANALKETYEEAGVLVTLQGRHTDYSYTRSGEVQHVRIYVAQLEVLLRKYPERGARQRKLFSFKKAAKLLPKPVTKLLEKEMML